MNKPNIFRRIGMRVLLWILADEQQSRTCELNRVLYQRSADGRSLSRFSHPQVEIGERTHGLKRECFIAYHPDDRVQIGKYCSIDGVRFIFGEHRTDRVTTFPLRAICFNEAPHADALSKGDIVVGNDVWVGAGGIVDTVRHEQTGFRWCWVNEWRRRRMMRRRLVGIQEACAQLRRRQEARLAPAEPAVTVAREVVVSPIADRTRQQTAEPRQPPRKPQPACTLKQ